MREPAVEAQRLARFGGVFYLAIIVCGVWSEAVVRSGLIVSADPIATAANIRASLGLFRASLAADSLMALCDVALAVVLYRLLRPVSPSLAMTAMVFRLVQAAVIGASLFNQQIAILMLEAPGVPEQTRNALALVFVKAHGFGYDMGLLFFGINCLLTGLLVFRSTYLPRALGILVAASGPVYLVGSYLKILLPAAGEGFQLAYLLPLVAESSFCLWLLVKGVDAGRWREAALGQT